MIPFIVVCIVLVAYVAGYQDGCNHPVHQALRKWKKVD